jgi:hypothetical protein
MIINKEIKINPTAYHTDDHINIDSTENTNSSFVFLETKPNNQNSRSTGKFYSPCFKIRVKTKVVNFLNACLGLVCIELGTLIKYRHCHQH